MAADLLIFDPEVIVDRADFGSEAMRYAEGVDYVLVNGGIVIDDGQLMDDTPGRVLRRSGR